MECQSKPKRRKSIRLKNFNYSNAGAYFVTICSQDMACLFGDVLRGETVLNEVGEMIRTAWSEIPYYFKNVQLDGFVLMPNHFHGIVWLIEAPVGVGPRADPREALGELGQPRGVAPTALFDIVYQFKSLTTNKYIQGVKTKYYKPFNKRLWQRNYYERVIRNEEELNNIRQYIMDNPKKWDDDKYNI